MVITCDEKVTLEKKMVSERELSDKKLMYTKNNLIDSDDNLYLTVDSLIDINNMITSSNNIILRKVNIKP